MANSLKAVWSSKVVRLPGLIVCKTIWFGSSSKNLQGHKIQKIQSHDFLSAVVFMWGPAVKETFIRFTSWHSLSLVLSVISEAVRILAPGTGHFPSVLFHIAFCFFFPVVESLNSGNIYPGLPSWKT